MWDAIITGKHHHFLDGEVDCNIKCIFKTEKCSPINQVINLKRGVEALRMPGKLEFVVAVDFFLTTDCLFSDIVLPVSTPWENEGGYADIMTREAIHVGNKVIEPLFETKPDWWIDKELANRLGIDESLVCPPNPSANYPMRIVNAKIVDKDGNESKLATVTAEDIAEMSLPAEPQEGVISIGDLYAQGGYQVERFEGDGFNYTPLASYIEDPVANPVPTASGKLEIFSRTLAQRAANYNTTPLEPIGKYVPSREGYEASFIDWENKVQGEYRFQLITLHQLRQAHSMGYNVRSLNEIFSNVAIINDLDAVESGLKTNDTALISSMHGQTLRRVQVTSRVMPGVIMMGEGNWIALDEKTGIDQAASLNYLIGDILSGEGQSPYNTVLLKVERWTGDPLEPDYKTPQRVLDL
jgi:anaerobic dimethyl sulfoxide reductase subunit A